MAVQSAVSEKYKFSNDVLVEGFPTYLQSSIDFWLRNLFVQKKFLLPSYVSSDKLTPGIVARIERTLRTEIPTNFVSLTQKMYRDSDLGVAIIDLFLRNCGDDLISIHQDDSYGEFLETILKTAGSAYMSMRDETGSWGLFRRVNDETIIQAKPAITKDSHLQKAWNLCYGVNPNPSESIKESTNAMEDLLKQRYFNGETKKFTFGQMLEKVKKEGFSFIGSNMVDDPNMLLDLMKKFTKKRGEHVENGCDYGTYEEAVYVLHTAIYIWTLCQALPTQPA